MVDLDIGPVAHGGHCVARHQGRVVFVRHSLPGERVRARITEAKRGSFCRADAIDVLEAAPGRVVAPCEHFHPGGCGGCDFQHASAELQRSLKAAVVTEPLRRLGGVQMPVTVEELPGTGFGWRTRVRWGVAADGAIGPRVHRSAEVVPISQDAPCLIASPGLTALAAELSVEQAADPDDTEEVVLTVAEDGSEHVTVPGSPDVDVIDETVHGRQFAVAADGFWQVHPAAAEAYVDAVRDFLPPVTGGVAWDLYGGVGLFAAFLADAVGRTGSVVTVELDRTASALAAANLADLPQVWHQSGMVEKVIGTLPSRADVVVLDPPRTGAGKKVCGAIAARSPEVIIYVACDPAALGRDTGLLAGLGYRLDRLRAFDAFPQTHHVECIARFVRS